MKRILMLTVGCSFAIFFGGRGACYGANNPEAGHVLTVNEVNAQRALADSLFGSNHIGFKGIYLTMSPDDLDQAVQHSVLEYRDGEAPSSPGYPKKVRPPKSEFSTTDIDYLDVYHCYYNCDSLTEDQKLWNCLGCDGNDHCYWLSLTGAEFTNSKISRIYTLSSAYNADQIESLLKGWATFAVAAYTKKYGQPTTTYRSVEDFSI